MKLDDSDMQETLVLLIDDVAYQLGKGKEGYEWVELDIRLKSSRTYSTAVTVPESFLCDFKCIHRTQKCEQYDYREELWEAQLGQVARKPCPDPIPGYARLTKRC